MNELIGQTIGPYKITEKIGEGGMAVVYKGYQQSLNRYVAIKVLRSELAQDEQFVTRFRREALAVAELSHPNILHVYDAGMTQNFYYIVMAYVDGGSLKDLINQGPLEMEYAVSIAAQLADALDHAYKHGIVHRDVKPNNVLITHDGRPLLTDFGIAKALNESQHLTRTGTSIGTPEYMAPEQIQGQKVDGRTDIYALGIVLYEMLVGWAPFSSTTPVAALYKQVNEPPPPMRQVNVSVPGWLEAVVVKALAKRPQDRYQRASEFAEALRQRRAPAKTPPPLAATAPVPVGQAEPERKHKKNIVPILIGAIALLFVTLAVAAFLLLNGDRGTTPSGTPQAVTITRVITPTPPAVLLAAPVLTSPPAGAELSGEARFEWQWAGPALASNQAFELRIWSQQEEDSGAEARSAATPTKQTSLNVDLASTATLEEHGPGTYYWTVVVVDTSTQRMVSEWGEIRAFEYRP